MTDYLTSVNEVLKVVDGAGIEVQGAVSNLIFSIFAVFFPEFFG